MSRSLFEKYGGFGSVSRMVLDFYNRLLDDDDLGPFFEEIDIGRVVDHQTKFIATVLGGPVSYTDDQIRALHRHLTIEDRHFDRLKALLGETLADHGMGEADIATVLDAFEARRELVRS